MSTGTMDVTTLAERFDTVLSEADREWAIAETKKWLKEMKAAYESRFASASGTRTMTIDLVLEEELASLG